MNDVLILISLIAIIVGALDVLAIMARKYKDGE